MTRTVTSTFIALDSSRHVHAVECITWPGLVEWDRIQPALEAAGAVEAGRKLFDMADLNKHTMALVDGEPALIAEYAGTEITLGEDEDDFHDYWGQQIRRVMKRIADSLAESPLTVLEAPLQLSLDENYSAWIILRASIATKELLALADKAIEEGKLV